MRSHWPRTVSGVNAGARVVNVSIGPEIVRPERLMVATCSDTASTKVTSWPARARNAPSVPPIAPAPHTRLRTGPPGSIQQGARFLDCDLPQREDFGVGALVAAAEVSVPQMLSERDRIHHADLLHGSHGPGAVGERHAGQAGPREDLHSWTLRRNGVDSPHRRPSFLGGP